MVMGERKRGMGEHEAVISQTLLPNQGTAFGVMQVYTRDGIIDNC